MLLNRFKLKSGLFVLFLMIVILSCNKIDKGIKYNFEKLEVGFKDPPMEAHPGVYWYFMDGNMDKKEMTKDLESMKEAGISHLVFLEVNVGVPRGEVDFMSDEWLKLFQHAEKEARRLEIAITLGIGPGWTGSGGPWVSGEESMKHLVSSETKVLGGEKLEIKLPLPKPHNPFFGEGGFTSELKERWNNYYEDVVVLAIPDQKQDSTISLLERKSLVYRYPFTSDERSIPYILSGNEQNEVDGIEVNDIIDLTSKMDEDGILKWDAPEGNFKVLRFVSRNNGAITRPAPLPGVGFESDKFDTTAIKNHLDHFLGKILMRIKPLNTEGKGGLKMLHMDSWEMGAQNWSGDFRSEFKKRRGYDPIDYFPVYHGIIVDNLEITNRFLWDLRITSQELIVENHAGFVKKYANDLGLGLSIEPYDMNPTSDLVLGSVADVPMAEFWTDTFNASYAVIEAASIGHVNGKKIIPSESFTSGPDEKLNHHPGSLKNIGDWAFAGGVNRFVYHTFAHKPLGDSLRPGMTMGPYGVHWDRGQTWWPYVKEYHTYVSRTSYLLQQGVPQSDILFLTPEGVPHVFLPPPSALKGSKQLPDKKGYAFDGIAPKTLQEKATVKDGKIVFPGGASYEVLVLPLVKTMTPELLDFIKRLLEKGATITGMPPERSPSLVNYPNADDRLNELVKEIWGEDFKSNSLRSKDFGQGKLFYGGNLDERDQNSIYPAYGAIAEVLQQLSVEEDFKGMEEIRSSHFSLENMEIYFLSNSSENEINGKGSFRVNNAHPQLWDPLTGEIFNLTDFENKNGRTNVSLHFETYQSYFLVFSDEKIKSLPEINLNRKMTHTLALNDPWEVSFDTSWGGPESVKFNELVDWSVHPNDSIKFYSGTAKYENTFKWNQESAGDVYLDLGEVFIIAEVKLNDELVGTLWTQPWRIKINDYIKEGVNTLEITVANQWANRLIGDERYPEDGIKDNKWPEWLLNKEKRSSKRLSFITYPFFQANDFLQPSGLLGPVQIKYEKGLD